MSPPVSWDDQRIFLAVLETGSLSAAARKLGVTHPTVRARIEALERALGAVLFTRSVHGLAPTETAQALRETARTMAMASDMFVRVASGGMHEISGTVRLSVPEIMGVEVVPPILAALHGKHPALSVELSLSNAQADILAHEVDLAVRTVTPRQEALVARKVASIPLGFFASADYVARRGSPQTLADLDAHALIGPDRSRSDLAAMETLGLSLAASRFALRTDSHVAQLAAARAGLGIAVCQVPLGERDPRLVRQIPELTPFAVETWIVTHENLARVPRVRAVFDALVEGFAGLC
ncbi:MAG: LysR family transcriptional regulator [Ottowia sp.]|uniref:LysR family transcriptional regulator n=1 Tax=Ottowia sp. TaxID=1898956 RepID=UPI0039E32C8E